MNNPWIDAFELAVSRALERDTITKRITFASGEVLSLDELLVKLEQEHGSDRCPARADFHLNEDAGWPLTVAEAVSRFRGRLRAKDIRTFHIDAAECAEVINDLALGWKAHKSVAPRVQVRMTMFSTVDFFALFEDDASPIRTETAGHLGLKPPVSVRLAIKTLRKFAAGGV